MTKKLMRMLTRHGRQQQREIEELREELERERTKRLRGVHWIFSSPVRYVRYYKGEPVGELMRDGSGRLDAMRQQAKANDDLEVRKVVVLDLSDDNAVDRRGR